MTLQQDISLQRNQELIGKRLTVLLEGNDKDLTVGRSYRDAPEIDGLVLVPEVVEPHRLVTVEITEALPYDLGARIV